MACIFCFVNFIFKMFNETPDKVGGTIYTNLYICHYLPLF